jgi:hypothetical protein
MCFHVTSNGVTAPTAVMRQTPFTHSYEEGVQIWEQNEKNAHCKRDNLYGNVGLSGLMPSITDVP